MYIKTTPYFSQRDNVSGTGYRECFSSSCAMLAAHYGLVETDDEYNRIRSRFGDTTNSYAQVQALKSLGLKVYDHTGMSANGTIAILKDLIADGIPVGVGWLHHGHVSAPQGGGHWSVAIGIMDQTVVMHDPYGEADLVNGGYLNSSGANQQYSFSNWGRRWIVEGPGSGWYLYCKK